MNHKWKKSDIHSQFLHCNSTISTPNCQRLTLLPMCQINKVRGQAEAEAELNSG